MTDKHKSLHVTRKGKALRCPEQHSLTSFEKCGIITV